MTKGTPMRTHDSPRGADHWLSFAALVLRRVVAASCDGARPTGHGHKATNSGLLGCKQRALRLTASRLIVKEARAWQMCAPPLTRAGSRSGSPRTAILPGCAPA